MLLTHGAMHAAACLCVAGAADRRAAYLMGVHSLPLESVLSYAAMALRSEHAVHSPDAWLHPHHLSSATMLMLPRLLCVPAPVSIHWRPPDMPLSTNPPHLCAGRWHCHMAWADFRAAVQGNVLGGTDVGAVQQLGQALKSFQSAASSAGSTDRRAAVQAQLAAQLVLSSTDLKQALCEAHCRAVAGTATALSRSELATSANTSASHTSNGTSGDAPEMPQSSPAEECCTWYHALLVLLANAVRSAKLQDAARLPAAVTPETLCVLFSGISVFSELPVVSCRHH